MLVRQSYRFLCTVLLTASLGCRETVAPLENISGVYVLSRSGDRVLPFTYEGAAVIADTLRLNADGTGLQKEVLDFTPGPPHRLSTSRVISHRALRGGRVEIVIYCAANEFCSPERRPVVAQITTLGIRLPSGWTPAEPDWEYVRVDPAQ